MSEVWLILLAFTPILVVMFLVNLAERERLASDGANASPSGLVMFSYGLLVLFYLVLFGVGMLMQVAGLLSPMLESDPGMAAIYQEQGVDPEAMAGLFDDLPLLAFGLWFPALVGMFLLLPPARRLVARIIPIDPNSHVHAFALALSMLVPINLLMTLGIGLDNLGESGAFDVSIVLLWAQQLLTALLAMIGVGWLTRRNLGATLSRLKIVLPSWGQIMVGVALGVALVGLTLLVVAGSEAVGWSNPAADELSEELFGPLLITLPGILTIGLAAALGEEALLRGAVQPRFGRIVTSLLFALLHIQYGLSPATIAILLVGYTLCWIRDRFNTTTAMVTHATFNMTQGLIVYVASTLLN